MKAKVYTLLFSSLLCMFLPWLITNLWQKPTTINLKVSRCIALYPHFTSFPDLRCTEWSYAFQTQYFMLMASVYIFLKSRLIFLYSSNGRSSKAMPLSMQSSTSCPTIAVAVQRNGTPCFTQIISCVFALVKPFFALASVPPYELHGRDHTVNKKQAAPCTCPGSRQRSVPYLYCRQ